MGSVATTQIITEQTDRTWSAVEEAKDTRLINGKLEILVLWKGRRDFGDTWEPFEMVYEYVPSVNRPFLLSKKNTGIIREARSIIGMYLV